MDDILFIVGCVGWRCPACHASSTHQLGLACYGQVFDQAGEPEVSSRFAHQPLARSAQRIVKVGLLLGALSVAAAAAAIVILERSPPVSSLSSRPTAGGQSIVFVSGDTGLRSWSIGGDLARHLAAQGNRVVAIDSLATFSNRHSPEQVSQVLRSAIDQVEAGGPRSPVVLIGHSYGADMIPIGMAQLDPAEKGEVSKVILIVPGTQAYLRVFPGEWLGTAKPDLSVGPYASKIKVPLTCIYGVQEKDSLCPTLSGANVTVIGMAGGHGLSRDSTGLQAVVARALRQPATKMTKE